METTFRNQVVPWPSCIKQTGLVRPIFNESAIRIDEPFQGEYITLINANLNKGALEFIEMAKRLPNHKFLGVLPYYGVNQVPRIHPPNMEWSLFVEDIRDILKRTRILVMPSLIESYGRVGVEAMYNGIPVLYSEPAVRTPTSAPHTTTEGMVEWMGDAGIMLDRTNLIHWTDAILALDDEDVYAARSQKVKDHIQSMDLFSETGILISKMETFARANPSVNRSSAANQPKPPQAASQSQPGLAMRPMFANGRLNVRR